jgi:hypothetical protein
MDKTIRAKKIYYIKEFNFKVDYEEKVYIGENIKW